jgi:hypothetical protein
MRLKPWSTRRLTLDYDRGPSHWRPPLDALRAVYNLKYLGLLASYRLDYTRRGCHLVVWLTEEMAFSESQTLRTMLGDDGVRVALDSKRPPYAAGVLWSRKGSFHVRKGDRRNAPLDQA